MSLISSPDVGEPQIGKSWIFRVLTETKNTTSTQYFIRKLNDGTIQSFLPSIKNPPDQRKLHEYLKQTVIRVGVIDDPPFLTFGNPVSNSGDSSKNTSGPILEMLRKMFEHLNATFELVEYNGDEYGLKSGKEWSGLFLKLEKREIDMIAGSVIISEERVRDFQATVPFYTTRYNFLFKAPSETAANIIFQFLLSFHLYVWILLLGTVIIFAVSLYVIQMISPNNLSFGVDKTFWFSFGYLFHGIRTQKPNRLSSQILVIVWWFFCLIICIAYVANFAAYRSFPLLDILPYDPSSLLHQNRYKYGFLNNSVLGAMLASSKNSVMRSLYETAATLFEDSIIADRDAGIKLVDKGNFAFIDESSFVEYYAKKKCFSHGEPFWQSAYALYMPKDFAYFDLINNALQIIRASGEIDAIITSELDSPANNCDSTSNGWALDILRKPLINLSPFSISFDIAAGLFILCTTSMIIVVIIVGVECFHGVHKKVSV